MTVQQELDRDNQRIEWLLCIEGIGWPVNEDKLSLGFAGDVFTTGDLDGDLATQLIGATIQPGLMLPTTISDEFNPRTKIYKQGAYTFTIQDHNDILQSKFTPLLLTGKQGVLNFALRFAEDANHLVQIDNAETSWETGEQIWIGGRESLKLGTKTLDAGTVFNYPDSVRGFLGTPKGRRDVKSVRTLAYGWDIGTQIDSFNRYWYNRRVALFMHVPGEPAANCLRIYSGKIRDMTLSGQGTMWILPTVHDLTGPLRRLHEGATANKVGFNSFIYFDGKRVDFNAGGAVVAAGPTGSTPGSPATHDYPTELDDGKLVGVRRHIVIRNTAYGDAFEGYASAFAYNYRNRVPGGTIGVTKRIAADNTDPQAIRSTSGVTKALIYSFVEVGGNILRALWKKQDELGPGTGGIPFQFPYFEYEIESSNFSMGQIINNLFDNDTPIYYLLDARHRDIQGSRWIVNNVHRNNPIDVLLMFLTTGNNEYFIGDQVAGSSNKREVKFAANSFKVDEWIGYALHCVESGSGGLLGESRRIVSNTTDTIFVDADFVVAPGLVSSREFQIRNSIYDVLPMGWGMDVVPARIDLASFEDVRDRFLGDARLGYFQIGGSERFDLWQLLLENICQPYGILVLNDRTSGLLTAVYVGEAELQDDLDQTYVKVTSKDILNIGEIEYMPRSPVGQITLKMRERKSGKIKPVTTWPQGWQLPRLDGYSEVTWNEPGVASKGAEITIRAPELESVFEAAEMENLSVRAMFNSTSDAAYLITKLIARLENEARPYPEVSIRLNISFLPKVQAGTLLNITEGTKWNPIDPYTGVRGWSQMIARVVSTKLSISGDKLGLIVKVQLVEEILGGFIAPAANTIAYGVDGSRDFIQVHDIFNSSEFSVQADDLDWGLFIVGDRIEIRSKNGVAKQGFIIESFGSNEVADPNNAVDGFVNVTSAIIAVFAAGDYITFNSWSPFNTANMIRYVAYADSNFTLGADNDPARQYC